MDSSSCHKVIWSEGLLIGPHHFQQSDRYHEHTLDLRVRPLLPFGWGALDLSIDLNALEQRNAFRLERFCGVLPSGTVVSIPDADDAPATREVTADMFPLPSGHLDVYLALPLDRPGGLNYRMSGGVAPAHDARYVPAFVTLLDECTGDNQQTIVTAKKNLRVLLGNESDMQLERIKIARLIRQPDGRVMLDQSYAPPCLALHASDYLARMVRSLARRLQGMVVAAADARHRAADDERSIDRLELLWAHSILSSSLALLNHFNQIQQIHPERMYCSLLQLAGHLHVLLPAGQVVDLPTYDHDDLAACFAQLIQSIETLLRAVPTAPHGPVITIDLEPAQSAAGYAVLRTRAALDQRLLADSTFYLVVEMAGERAERLQSLSKHLSDTITVAPTSQIDRYIERAYGLRMVVEQRPLDVSAQPQSVYFQLDRAGAPWEGIRSECALAIHIPPAIWQECKQLDITLIAVRQQAQRNPR